MSESKPTPDPDATSDWVQGFAAAVAIQARAGWQTSAQNLMDEVGFTIHTLIQAGVEDYDLDPIKKALS